MDPALSAAAVSVASQSFPAEILVKFFSDWSGYALLGIALSWILYDLAQSKISQKVAFATLFKMAAAAFVSRGIITEAIRFFWHRERPSMSPEASFPSGHAAFYFAIAAVAYAYDKKLGTVCFVIATLMGVGRVFAGHHWPSDIIGGAAVGILSGFLTVKLLRRFYVQKS